MYSQMTEQENSHDQSNLFLKQNFTNSRLFCLNASAMTMTNSAKSSKRVTL